MAGGALNEGPDRPVAAPPGGFPADTFVGRTAELQVLDAEIDKARAGPARLVLVEGPAGIGKTALIRRFLASTAGARVLSASGDENESGLPYGLLDQLLLGIDASPAAATLSDDPPPDPLAAGARLLDLLGSLSSDLVALVVDDAQWADTPSLQALTFVLRRLRADAVLAVVAARNDATNLPEGLRRLTDGEHGVRISLGGLDIAEVAELAASLGKPDLARSTLQRLVDHTGGNALHCRALLEELDEDSLRRSEGPLRAPRTFAALVLARLAACSPQTVRLVQAATVLGSRCPVGQAATLAGVTDPAAALEQAITAQVLDLGGPDGREVTFPHPLVRAAIYHDLGPACRCDLHARAAVLVDGPAALEHRIAAALVEDEELSGEVERQARAEAGRGARSAAALHLQAAARLHPRAPERERLILDAVEMFLAAGEAPRAAELAAELAHFTDSARRRYVLAHLALMCGRQEEAEGLLLGAWEACDAATNDELGALISALLAQLYMNQMRVGPARDWARRAMGLGGTPEVVAPLQSILIIGTVLQGQPEQALAEVAWLPSSVVSPTSVELDALLGRGLARLWSDDLAGACADLAILVEASRPMPASHTGLFGAGWLAQATYRRGEWDDSVVLADLAVSLATDTDQMWLTTFVHSEAVWVLAARGQWDQAGAHVAAGTQAAQLLGDAASIGHGAVAAAHLAFCRGEPAAVVEALDPIRSHPAWQSVREPSVLPWRELDAQALIDLGRLDDAERLVAEVEDLSSAVGRASCQARVQRLRGSLQAGRGEIEAARKAFEGSLDLFNGVTMPFETALSHDAYGRFLRRRGERRAAAVQLRAAVDAFRHLGAMPFLTRTERELTACGVPTARRTEARRLALTPQELSVAQLVLAGRTNREVAAELVVSVKTVEYHLGNVFAKTGISSRRHLASALGV